MRDRRESERSRRLAPSLDDERVNHPTKRIRPQAATDDARRVGFTREGRWFDPSRAIQEGPGTGAFSWSEATCVERFAAGHRAAKPPKQ
jgi:hypothetical protein